MFWTYAEKQILKALPKMARSAQIPADVGASQRLRARRKPIVYCLERWFANWGR